MNRKADLLLERGETAAASALNQEALRLGVETAAKEYLFNAQVLAARIAGARGKWTMHVTTCTNCSKGA